MHQTAIEFVCEFGAVDGTAAGAGAGRVAALNHEARDDAVEDHVVVFVRRSERGEVGGRAGDLVFEEGNGDVAVVGGEEDAGGILGGGGGGGGGGLGGGRLRLGCGGCGGGLLGGGG